MAAIEAKTIQGLLARIRALKVGIETAGNQGRTRLKGISVDDVCREVPCDAQGSVNADEWSKKPPGEQGETLERLIQVRDSLQIAAGLDGPTDPHHIMYSTYASTTSTVAWTAAGLVITLLLLVGIVTLWNRATGTDYALKVQDAVAALDSLDRARAESSPQVLTTVGRREPASEKPAPVLTRVATGSGAGVNNTAPSAASGPADAGAGQITKASAAEIQRVALENATQLVSLRAIAAIEAIRKGGADERSVLTMVILLGALGGAIHFLRSLVTFVGNRQLKRSWLLYYMSTPVTGAGLAIIVYMLMRVGLLSPQGTASNGSAIANLNLIAIYAFAALAGLFAGTALDKMAEIFKTVFRSEKPSKDQLSAGAGGVVSGTNP